MSDAELLKQKLEALERKRIDMPDALREIFDEWAETADMLIAAQTTIAAQAQEIERLRVALQTLIDSKAMNAWAHEIASRALERT